jgi:hypothetical protein
MAALMNTTDLLPVEVLKNVLKKSHILKEIVSATVEKSKYTIFRIDGSVFTVQKNQLHAFQFQTHDLILVGPHGEMVPPLTLAMRQGMLPQHSLHLMHIDAHYDNSPAGKDITKQISTVLHSSEQDIEQELQTLQQLTDGTINRFMHELRGFVQHISALVLYEDNELTEVQKYCKNSTKQYLDDYKPMVTTQRSEKEIMQITNAHVYSIDPDFAMVATCKASKDSEDKYQQASQYIIDVMQYELTQVATKQPKLYVVSLDPNWVAKPYKFMEGFLQGFYLPLVEALKTNS